MKKLCSILFLVLLVSSPTFAQGLLRFGVRGGYDLVDRTLNLSSSNRTGFHIGLAMDANIPVLPVGIQAAVLYSYRNFDTNDADYAVTDSHFLDVPVDLKYSIGLGGVGIVFTAGPYIRFNLDGGKADISNAVDHIAETYKAKTFQAGANFGVGMDLGKHFYIGVSYYTSLTDCYADDKGKISDVFDNRPDRMSLTATYYF